MKYIDEFRNQKLAINIANNIYAEVNEKKEYRLMEFCGGHTHAIARYGIVDLIPKNIKLIHGPGCPVCVLPIGRIDQAIKLAKDPQIILCTYADTLRIPASNNYSLNKAKANGCDIRMIYSTDDALKISIANPDKQVVFFAIGFETTTPPTAVAILQAKNQNIRNFSVISNHVLTPSAMHAILESESGTQLDGFIGPAHVSTIIGFQPYEIFSTKYQKPVVISGFEPLDIMQSILMLIRQINKNQAKIANEFTRSVTRKGNQKAQDLVNQVFEVRSSFEWRGLGRITASALQIRSKYRNYDAEKRFNLKYSPVADNKACECASILRGIKEPKDCKIFATVCTPDNPIGSCMVSSEGACAAFYLYGRYRQ